MKRFAGVSDAIRREADLFYADLIGEPIRPRRGSPSRTATLQPWPKPWEFPSYEEPPASSSAQEDVGVEDTGIAEVVPRGGQGSFRYDPLGGLAGDNVEARWNVDSATKSGSTIDVVVYFHGFGYLQKGETERGFLSRKAVEAGLDMLDASGAARLRTSSPTLALIPRGKHDGGRGWYFEKLLPNRAAFEALVDAGLKWLCATVLGLPSGSSLTRGRLTLMAHSGGGAGLSKLLETTDRVDPDEVVCFDALYGGEGPIREWALARIASPSALKSGLRVFYTGCEAPSTTNPSGRWVAQKGGGFSLEETGSWSYSGRWILQTTEPYSRRVHDALERTLKAASNGAALADRFRVQRTSVSHPDIPASYAPLLLDNIAATVPKTTAPPSKTSRPVCVANDDWLTAKPRKPGGDDPPPPKPTAPGEVALEDAERVYDAPDRRPYSPSTSATLFRTPPNPIAVAAATEWPETATDADHVTERALRALGVDPAGIVAFSGAGTTAMRPIAAAFGEPALIELLRRLRYGAGQLIRPPHSFASDAALTRAFGRAVPRAAILAMRTLLAIPGHFRQLARQAGNEPEAFAVENLGWLLFQSLGDEVRAASGINFWLPVPPAFVTPFGDPVPGLSPQTERLIVARMLFDTSFDAAEYQRRYQAWRTGPAGRSWRLETGRETVPGRLAGSPFYPEVFTIPPSVNVAPQRAQVHEAWARRVADFDAGTTTVPLTRCDNAYLTSLHVMSRISLRGLQLRSQFPSSVSAPALSTLTGLAAVQPAFEAAFQAIVDLGWNDLLVETQGMGCFRGKKIPGNPAAARHMSEHSLGIAVDLNVFENGQNTAGSMDPRIVALFEAFRFRWGKGFAVPDPMHFEYAG